MPESTTSERNETKLAVMANQISNIEGNMKQIRDDLRGLIAKIDDHYVTKEDISPLDKRVSDLEGMKDWGVRIVVGAIIASVLGLILL